jgi:DhnA family fructose-bisphosphate aldolase class Ia
MKGISYRLQELFTPQEHRGLFIDASAGTVLGVLPGLDNFSLAVNSLLPWIDGLVCSPGHLRRIEKRTRSDASLLVRVDWSNALRSKDFILPPNAIHHMPILSPQDALDMGAAAMVSTFFLGYEEEIEADCMKKTVQYGLAGKDIGLPLLVDVNISGPRVSLPSKAIELGVSYALEGGADVIVVPYPGTKSLESIAAMVSVPWLVKPSSLESLEIEVKEALNYGVSGCWIDHKVFILADPLMAVRSWRDLLITPASR